MDWKTFISSMIGSLAWPAAFMMAVLLMRRHIAALLPYTRSFRYKDFEISFEKDMAHIRDQVKTTLPETGMASDRHRKLYSLSSISPASAVLEAWEAVEKSAGLYILAQNSDLVLDIETPYKQMEDLLLNCSRDVDMKKIKIFRELRILRNKAAHAPQFHLTRDQARGYVDLALPLADYFDTMVSSKVKHLKS